MPGGGKRFKSWSLLEVSVVTIPADARAKIQRDAKTGGPRSLANHSGGVRLKRTGAVYFGGRLGG